jgi:hypothetical protein
MHIQASPDVATLVLSGQSVIDDSNGHTVLLSDLRAGDWVRGGAIPTPDKALVYLGSTIDDFDLTYEKDLSAQILKRPGAHRAILVQAIGGSRETVPVGSSTRLRGPGWGRGLRSLKPGDILQIQGVYDTRLGQWVRIVSLRHFQPAP